MSTVSRHEWGLDFPARFNRLDKLFEEWFRTVPLRRPFNASWEWPAEDLIHVDEYRDGTTQVIRADLPGIDPDKDVEVTVADGMVRISAERKVEDKSQDKGFIRHELHYGRLTRTLPLAEGAGEGDITASYKDGVLEIRVPVAEPQPVPEAKKITIGRS